MKTSQQITDYFLNNIQDHFNINFEDGGSPAYVTKKYGAYLLEFSLCYDYKITSHRYATHDNPEEFSWSATPTKVSDVVIYINNEFQEMEDEDLDKIAIKLLETIKPDFG